MRLLHVHTLEFDDFTPGSVPPYAIASHRWETDEITYQDLKAKRSKEKAGYIKVQGFADYVKRNLPNISWIWIDTCCIDKQNHVELSEAINSMFQWYHDSAVCLAYLSDVPLSDDRRAFNASIWFCRGWTLQELIAPQMVVFLSCGWQVIGHKGSDDQGKTVSSLDKGQSLNKTIATTAGIPEAVLQDYCRCRAISTDEKLRWMDGRKTTYEEDRWYCLLGIFGISMTIRYGTLERGETTKRRFLAKVKKNALPDEHQETSPPLPHNVPFPRDPDFIDRTAIGETTLAKLAMPAGRAALVGLGGVGKSQLAIEYSHRMRIQAPQVWTFWIHASNESRFEQSVREIADLVELDRREDPDVDIFALFRNWLRSRVGQKWIVVLDNADDASFLLEKSPSSGRRLFDCLPICDHGSVLITSRSEDAALRLVETNNIILVSPMDKEDAVALLVKKLGLETEEQAFSELASVLEYMPLAITQAAAYIHRQRGRCSVQQYLGKLRKSDRSKKSILDNDAGDLRRDSDARNSIILTWQISFEHIRHSRPSAAALLSLMSFCDRQAIPEILLRVRRNDVHAYSHMNDTGSVCVNDEGHGESSNAQVDHAVPDNLDESASLESEGDEFDSDIAMLGGFSFISTVRDASTFEMHRLVQLSTQRWLAGQGQLEQWKDQYISNLHAVFPPGDYENWTMCQSLLPHAKAASILKVQSRPALLKWAFVMNHASRYAEARGSFADAESMARRCMQVRRRELGDAHSDTLISMADLASTYWAQGRWEEAEELQVKVLESSMTVLGEAHSDTLISMADLASTYWAQGRWEEAEELQVKVLESSITGLGEAYPDTLISMANLASTYWTQSRWEEAEELQVKVLETRRAVLGEAHPDTLKSIANLASTYWTQGRWEEAEKSQEMALYGLKQIYGLQHPVTVQGTANLAYMKRRQGRAETSDSTKAEAEDTRPRQFRKRPDTDRQGSRRSGRGSRWRRF